MDPIDKKIKKPLGTAVKGKKVPIILNPDLAEKAISEGKEFVIGPQTSNRTLGQLKSRKDHVGVAARAELRRRGRLDNNQAAVGDYLSGKKPIDAEAAKTLEKAGKKSKLSVYDVIKQKQREQELKAYIAKTKNRNAQARFKSKRRKAETAQSSARQEVLANFMKQFQPHHYSSHVMHVMAQNPALVGPDVIDAAHHEFEARHKIIHKQAMALDSIHKTIKFPLAKRSKMINSRIDKFITDNAPFWPHMARLHTWAQHGTGVKGMQSTLKQIKKSHVYGRIARLQKRIKDSHEDLSNMKDQRSAYGSELGQNEYFYRINGRNDGDAPTVIKFNGSTPVSGRPASIRDIERYYTKPTPETVQQSDMAKDNENTTPPPEATTPMPKSRLSNFFRFGRGSMNESIERIATSIRETQHMELVRRINAKKT